MHNNNKFSNIDQTFIIPDVAGKKYLHVILFSNEVSFYQTWHDVDRTYLGRVHGC